MNKFLIVLTLLFVSLFVIGAGCGETPNNGDTNGGTAEWCQAGTSWAWTGTTGQQTPAAADFKILGLEQFKGKQYCHAHWTYEEQGQLIGEYNWYFIEEDGEVVDAWYVAESQGQTFEYHYTGE